MRPVGPYIGGTAAAAPPPFSPGNPALCGSRTLVPPYYCRLGDLLCLFVYPLFVYYFVCMHMCILSFFGFFLCSFLLQYFDTVGWVFGPVKNRWPYNLYCVGADVKPCSINQSGPYIRGGTAAVAPPPFRPGNPALCGSHPLVTPY